MIKEIGSEFWSVPLKSKENNIFPKNVAWYTSGRFALKAIIKDIKSKRNFKSVAMPSWCCETMIIPFIEEGIGVNFYSIYVKDGELYQDFTEIEDVDAVLLMDYFGYKRVSFPQINSIVIFDATHSVFSNKNYDADYIFGSLRKWAGFYTGGFAFSKNGKMETFLAGNSEFEELRIQAMEKKSLFIQGKTKEKDFLNIFSQANSLLGEGKDFGASKTDIIRAQKLDVEKIRTKRRENSQILIENLPEITLFSKIKKEDCPLFVPILLKNKRDEIRRTMIEQKIYCPIHWPESKYHKLNAKTRKIYEEEISLVCDQRYTEEDMNRVIAVLKKAL